MQPETILQLKKLSVPRQFGKDDYICQEGQPGSEMYIILKGSVGVFLTNAIGTLTQVATIREGDFFGEMAIFDNLPRSASCIALEDTIAVAVTKDNLQEFLATCPEIAKQMLENMSGRIRKLDAELYKNNRFVKNRHVPRFAMPRLYQNGHTVRPPRTNPDFLMEYKQACPICGKAVSVKAVKRNVLVEETFDYDCRVTYKGCDPLWYEVIACPHCYYANHYLKFFGINNFEFELVEKLLHAEHKPIVEARLERRSDYDYLVLRYLQAININEHINPDAHALIGSMWRNLCWLSRDVNDIEFAKFCAQKVVEQFKAAVDENKFTDATSKGATALSLVSMMIYCDEKHDILKYINVAVECPDEKIRGRAVQMKNKIEQKLKRQE